MASDTLVIVFVFGSFIVGVLWGWIIGPYLDKIAEWRKKRMKKEVEQCLA